MKIENITEAHWTLIDIAATDLGWGEGEYREWIAEGDYASGSIAFTRDTLADFQAGRATWTDQGEKEVEDGYIVFRNCQGFKGQTRHDFAVADCGDFRVVIKI